MTLCNWCGDKITNQSYFIRELLDPVHKDAEYWMTGGKSIVGKLIEVCPECHHHCKYAPPDLLEKYKKRRGIK